MSVAKDLAGEFWDSEEAKLLMAAVDNNALEKDSSTDAVYLSVEARDYMEFYIELNDLDNSIAIYWSRNF
ncbi:hypothetical protein HPT27_05545 [Permianibacter sp. IMCC34836]|uniref:hypothetical protein n=1 Tax=Permianibacter fluminis TaxID=2738515 RepID=UPI00155632F2|nr:hypothetical protein [Permianibacter fluminis]NQD36483.1 hypothetical protein [Permianibacter fluminis]